MYTGTYAPWEHYPKNLRQYEIENPISVVADFFFADSVKGHGKRLKEWRYYVVNDKHYDEERHGPGTLLFLCDLNLKILEAMYLLLQHHRNFSYKKEKITEAQLSQEKERWDYYPKNLSIKEQLDPYKAVKKVFKKIKPQAYRDYLREWSHLALYTKADTEDLYAGEIITVYENLLKLYAAAWMIYQREGGDPELKVNDREENLPDTGLAPVRLRTICTVPTAAERLALEELKAMILKTVPFARLIIHLGTHPKPFTFYLLIITGNADKTPEHEIANMIEDNCRQLAHVNAIVHNETIAVKRITDGEPFWPAVLEKGFVVYSASDFTLPEYREIPNEALLQQAKFNWERWGIQGLDFLKGAEHYRDYKKFRLAAFLLHQSVESVLKGIIQAVIGYTVEMHNLSKLLSLTLLFTDGLKEVFELDTVEGVQHYTLLQNAYTQSRYNSAFDPDEASVSVLTTRVKSFYEMAERIYRQYVMDLS